MRLGALTLVGAAGVSTTQAAFYPHPSQSRRPTTSVSAETGLQTSYVSPTSTEEFEQFVEAIRQNHEKTYQILDSSRTEVGNTDPFLDYITQGQLTTDLPNIDLGGIQMEAVWDKFTSSDSISLSEIYGLDHFYSSLSMCSNQLLAFWESLGGALNLKETGLLFLAASVLVLGSYGTSKASVTEAPMDSVMEPEPDKPTAIVAGESQLEMLQRTTKLVTQQLNELKIQKVSVDYELASLKSEVRDVQNKLELSISREKELQVMLAAAQDEMARETSDLKLQLQQGALVEQDLRTKLSTVEEELSKEKKNVEKVQAEAKKEVSAANEQVIKLREENKELKDELIVLRGELEFIKPEIGGRAEVPITGNLQPNLGEEKILELANTLEDIPSPGEKTRGAPSSAGDTSRPTLQVAVKSDNTQEKMMKTAAKKTTSRKMPINKRTTWSNLTVSTLKRKTVKQLVEYLEAKGENPTGPDGKTFKKDTLIEIVMSL